MIGMTSTGRHTAPHTKTTSQRTSRRLRSRHPSPRRLPGPTLCFSAQSLPTLLLRPRLRHALPTRRHQPPPPARIDPDRQTGPLLVCSNRTYPARLPIPDPATNRRVNPTPGPSPHTDYPLLVSSARIAPRDPPSPSRSFPLEPPLSPSPRLLEPLQTEPSRRAKPRLSTPYRLPEPHLVAPGRLPKLARNRTVRANPDRLCPASPSEPRPADYPHLKESRT